MADEKNRFPFSGICEQLKLNDYELERINRINKLKTFYEQHEFYEIMVDRFPEQRLATDRRKEKTRTSKRMVRSARLEQSPQSNQRKNENEQLGFF